MTIPATLKRYASKIESIDDERGTQNGYWVNLKKGWIDAESGCHAIHEDTLYACATRFAFVEQCKCSDCEPPPAPAPFAADSHIAELDVRLDAIELGTKLRSHGRR